VAGDALLRAAFVLDRQMSMMVLEGMIHIDALYALINKNNAIYLSIPLADDFAPLHRQKWRHA